MVQLICHNYLLTLYMEPYQGTNKAAKGSPPVHRVSWMSVKMKLRSQISALSRNLFWKKQIHWRAPIESFRMTWINCMKTVRTLQWETFPLLPMLIQVFVNIHLNQDKIVLTKCQLHITYCILKKKKNCCALTKKTKTGQTTGYSPQHRI